MINEYWEAPAVQAIVGDLVDLHEKRLKMARIHAVFTSAEKKRDGDVVIVWTKKLDAVSQYLAGTPREDDQVQVAVDGADFVIVVYAPYWANMKGESQTRMLHHELMRMRGHVGKWKLIDGDFEGFVDELVKYGPWRYELRQVAEALSQQELPLLEGATR